MATKKEIQKRRRQVLELKLQGFTLERVAEHTGMSLQQAYRDCKAIKQVLSKELQEKGDELIAELKEAQRLRIQRLWFIIKDKSSRKSDILKAIEVLQKEEDKTIRRAQLIGVLSKDSEFVKVSQDGVGIKQEIDVYQALLEISRADEKIKEEIKIESKNKEKCVACVG